jgi:3-hydroxypropanoate dehydrogenase
MKMISTEDQKILFTEARTYRDWLPQEVSDQTLRELYDLMKWAPTSANTAPARIVFVKNGPEKEKLLGALMPQNVDKVKTAPVTAIIAFDEKFYDFIPQLFPVPQAASYRDMFAGNKVLSDESAMRNGSLQGGYFILAARALGLDCGPISGFDNKKLDEAFFAGTFWKSNFICSLGHGDSTKQYSRGPRLSFEEACRIV